MPAFPPLPPMPPSLFVARVSAFMACRKLAIVGVSREGKGFGNMARKELAARGYALYGVHPMADSIEGLPCARSVAQVAPQVEAVLLVTPPEQTLALLQEARDAGLTRVWLQQGAATAEAVTWCEAHGMEAIWGHCVLMFLEPGSFPHGFHRWILQLVGKVPRLPAVRQIGGPTA